LGQEDDEEGKTQGTKGEAMTAKRVELPDWAIPMEKKTVELNGKQFRHCGVWQPLLPNRQDYRLKPLYEFASAQMEVELEGCYRIMDSMPIRSITSDLATRVPYYEICPLFKVKKWWISPRWRGAPWELDAFWTEDKIIFLLWERTNEEIEYPPFGLHYDDEQEGQYSDLPPDPRLVQERYTPKTWHDMIERV